MRATMLGLAAGLIMAAGAAEAAGFILFNADNSGAISFIMPSNNVACVYTPAGGSSVYMPADGGPELSCDRAAPTYLRFTLAASGPASLISNVGDQGCCGGDNTFPYGTAWRVAPFTCTSSTAGLACKRDDGHGFFISRATVQAY